MTIRSEIKSVGYYFVSEGFNVYFDEKDENHFLVSQLVCKDCKSPWYMELKECSLCGMVNSFVKKCPGCGDVVSTTNSTSKCSNCDEEYIYSCLNDECPSNENETTRDATMYTNSYSPKKGVFARNSVFSNSMTFCLSCGNESNMYITKKVFFQHLEDDSYSTKIEKEVLTKYNQEAIGDEDSVLILKNKKGKYSTQLGSDLKDSKYIKLEDFEENINTDKFYETNR